MYVQTNVGRARARKKHTLIFLLFSSAMKRNTRRLEASAALPKAMGAEKSNFSLLVVRRLLRLGDGRRRVRDIEARKTSRRARYYESADGKCARERAPKRSIYGSSATHTIQLTTQTSDDDCGSDGDTRARTRRRRAIVQVRGKKKEVAYRERCSGRRLA